MVYHTQVRRNHFLTKSLSKTKERTAWFRMDKVSVIVWLLLLLAIIAFMGFALWIYLHPPMPQL